MKVVNQSTSPVLTFKNLCKSCKHVKNTGKWKYCTKGMGTFPRYAQFQECRKFELKEKQEIDRRKYRSERGYNETKNQNQKTSYKPQNLEKGSETVEA